VAAPGDGLEAADAGAGGAPDGEELPEADVVGPQALSSRTADSGPMAIPVLVAMFMVPLVSMETTLTSLEGTRDITANSRYCPKGHSIVPRR